jgi:hypothetical protein
MKYAISYFIVVIFTLVHTATLARAGGDAASGAASGLDSTISNSLNALNFKSVQPEIRHLPYGELDDASAGKTGTHCVSNCPMSVTATTWIFGIPAAKVFSMRNRTSPSNHSAGLFRPPIS